jgi:AcrR family transcriptional regulator
MPAATRTPRERWVSEGLRALAEGGPDAVRIEPLARALGVTKGGFYWHFSGRRALLDEMLEAWERMVIDEVIDRVEAGGGDERARLHHLFEIARTSSELGRIELAVRDWARRDRAAARRLRRVDNRRMDYMRRLFRGLGLDDAEVEARSFVVMALFVGSPFIVADHGRLSRGDVVDRVLARLQE